MMTGRNQYSVGKVSAFVAAFIDRSPGFVEKCDLTWMSLLYDEMKNKVIFDQRSGGYLEGELVRLPSEI